MENKRQLIYVDDAKRAIEHIDPAFSYVIDNVPLADAVEVVHGRWIRKSNMIWCSHCGDAPIDEAYNWYPVETPYCPMCGAKMDGDGNA